MESGLRYYYEDEKSQNQMESIETFRKYVSPGSRHIYDKMVGRKRSILSFFVKPDGTYTLFNKIDWSAMRGLCKKILQKNKMTNFNSQYGL